MTIAPFTAWAIKDTRHLLLVKMPVRCVWRTLLSRLSTVAQQYDCRVKDLILLSGEEDLETSWQAAVDGLPRLKAFSLWEYSEENGFSLLREPLI